MDQQVHERGISLIKPLGIFASSLQAERKVDSLYASFVSLIIILRIFLEIILLYYSGSSIQDELKNFNFIWIKLFTFTIGIQTFFLLCRRIRYQRFVLDLETILIFNVIRSNQYINKQRKNLQIVNIINIIYEIFFSIRKNGPLDIIRSITNGQSEAIMMIISYVIHLISAFAVLIIFNFLVETCIHLQACFYIVKSNVGSINKKSNKLLEEIVINRSIYTNAIGVTRKIDSYLNMIIFVYYINAIVIVHLSFVDLFHGESKQLIHRWIWFIGEFFYLFFITYHLTYVNRLAFKCYDKVYAVSIDVSAQSVVNEINLFLERINRNDIGFTFANLYVISPNFVSSLATISLTLALAAPELTMKNKV